MLSWSGGREHHGRLPGAGQGIRGDSRCRGLLGPNPSASQRTEAAVRVWWTEKKAEAAIFVLYHARAGGQPAAAGWRRPWPGLGHPTPPSAVGGRDCCAPRLRGGRGSGWRPHSPRGQPNPGAARARREPHWEARAAAASPGEPSRRGRAAPPPRSLLPCPFPPPPPPAAAAASLPDLCSSSEKEENVCVWRGGGRALSSSSTPGNSSRGWAPGGGGGAPSGRPGGGRGQGRGRPGAVLGGGEERARRA